MGKAFPHGFVVRVCPFLPSAKSFAASVAEVADAFRVRRVDERRVTPACILRRSMQILAIHGKALGLRGKTAEDENVLRLARTERNRFPPTMAVSVSVFALPARPRTSVRLRLVCRHGTARSLRGTWIRLDSLDSLIQIDFQETHTHG